MAQRILSVQPASPAAKAGLKAGDLLLRIGSEPVIDFLDYQALTAEKKLEITIRRDGQEKTLRIRKDEYADLGLCFEKPMMSGMRMCCNKCLFCFVDQLPGNVRPTMRVKDDDWRMSMMMGNYVTLTNVSDRELTRIIERHASPLYISVHAADPQLRAHILGQERGKKLLDQLKKLSDGGIEFHTQAVLCPGVNDGDALEDTIRRLIEIPGALSLALVPVGLTGHRDGLTPLKPYTKEQAQAVIEIANRWREKLLKERGTRFVFPSDEFYLQAGVEVPSDEEYEDYGQIDDGVGLLRLLETEFSEAYDELPAEDKQSGGEKQLLIGCGLSAAPFLTRLMDEHPLTGIRVKVVGVENQFFGPTVTVSGLVTGRDLTGKLQGEAGEKVFITECMLRSEGDRFLDDMELHEAEQILGKPIIPVGRRGDELLAALLEAR
ncbi:MAG: DUF512 domain-containing protein [Clostridia bacterium]|nr:DUF512 domain-containing protein [Clostridia bacterium]